MSDKAFLATAPFLLRRCESAIAVAICAGMVAGLVSAIPYVFSLDHVTKATIYSITGRVFWSNFYFTFGLAGGAALSFFILEVSLRGKAYFYLEKNKIKLLQQLYADPVATKRERIIINAFVIFSVLFSASFGLQMGLGVLKSFILR